MREKRSSLVTRLAAVLKDQKATIDQVAMATTIPSQELRRYLNGDGYLFTRELDRLRLELPRFERRSAPSGLRKPESQGLH